MRKNEPIVCEIFFATVNNIRPLTAAGEEGEHTRIPETEYLPENPMQLLRGHVLRALPTLGWSGPDTLDALHFTGHFGARATRKLEEQVPQHGRRIH